MRGQSPPPSIVTDRPDQTESSLTVSRGSIQIEAGAAVSWSSDVSHAAAPELLVRFGLADRIEGRFGFQGWQTWRGGLGFGADGTGDIELGFKYNLARGVGARPTIALLADVAFPTGSPGFSVARPSPVMRLSVSHELSETVSTGYNVGLSVLSEQDLGPVVTAVDALYTWTFGFALGEKVGAFIETFGTVGLNDSGTHTASVDGGVTIRLSPNLQLDLSGGVGLSRTTDDWFFGLGTAVRLPK